ncbi:MAG: DUF3800 domain-containing protein [Bacteroidetes bacterium]|nr:MAG: DUF3800 domain-containing protein [Bacteroidota bacterium]
MEYFIYCDESISNGRYFSDFYGGALVKSSDYFHVNQTLLQKKEELNLHQEIKWTKVTANYLEKYKEMISTFFEFIEEERVKVRIMFRQTAQVPSNLSKEQKDKGFHLLYYQFIKYAFGLVHSTAEEDVYLRLFFDKLPDNKIKNEQFLNYIFGLQSLQSFSNAKLKIRRSDIVEIDSHNHVILQLVDIVLGAMAFRLNDLHRVKPPGQRNRGNRTIAKEKLYKHIYKHITRIYPRFNIGTTTGKFPREKIWTLPYRHWKFTPKEFTVDESRYK